MPVGPFVPYLLAQAVVVVATLVVLVQQRRRLALTDAGYRAQLLAPWRLALFAIALAAFVLGAPMMGDPTWDAIDATFMSVGCYVTAPWFCATAYRTLFTRTRTPAVEVSTGVPASAGGRNRVGSPPRPPPVEVFVAIVLWLAVTSWSYDAYLVMRDGVYPVTFRENAVASTILYLLGGLFFSVGRSAERGLEFVFMDARWPRWHGDPWTPRAALGASLLLLALMAPVVTFLVWLAAG